MSSVKILVVAASTREGSFNQRLADCCAALAAEQGADITPIRLEDFDLPIYSHRLEMSVFPEDARRLKALFVQHDAMLIASPEYNGSITPLLKNAIDWVSRPTDGEGAVALSAFRGKVAGIFSASPGPFGGLRGLMHLRQILGTVQVLVVPEQAAVPFADRAFEGARLSDPVAAQILPVLVRRVIKTTAALK